MAKNQEKKKGMCEKIFRAVTSPVRTVRRISTPNQQPQEEAVRVKFSETTAKPIPKIEQPKKETLITRVDTTLKTDERFTDYITNAKLKITAKTRSDDVPNASETETRDHHHDHHVPPTISRSSGRSSDRFSEYIKKAKMKLRSSSTFVRANTTHDS